MTTIDHTANTFLNESMLSPDAVQNPSDENRVAVENLFDNTPIIDSKMEKAAEADIKLAEQRIRYLRNKLQQAEKEKDEQKASVTVLKTRFSLEKESLSGKVRQNVGQFLGDDPIAATEAAMITKLSSLALVDSKISELYKELETTQSKTFQSKDIIQELKIIEVRKELEDSRNESLEITKTIDGLKEKIRLEDKNRLQDEEAAALAIATIENETVSKIALIKEAKDKELKELGDKLELAESIFRKQNKALSDTEKLIERYERERGSVTKIAKLGLNVAGERTKETIKTASRRGRSLARRMASPRRSLSRGLSSSFSSARRQKDISDKTSESKNEDKQQEQRESLDLTQENKSVERDTFGDFKTDFVGQEMEKKNTGSNGEGNVIGNNV